jgi:signal transduction histidine kinase
MMDNKLLTDIEETFSKNNDIKKLLVDTCKIISDSGNYSLCWIGIINENTGRMEPVPECEIDLEYLETIYFALNQSMYETQVPSENIFNIGKYYVNNDIWNDPVFKGWRDKAIPPQFNSIAIFPLIQNLKTIGAVYLYSDKKGFFKHDELMLLQILSMNLSLALDKIKSDQDEKTSKPKLLNKEQELKSQNEKLLITREKTEELNRLKAAFLTNMSHKIRTPLNSIIGFADLLAKSENTPEERLEYSQLIVSQSNYLLQLINNILQISKLDTHTVPLYKETVSLNKLLDELHSYYLEKLESLDKKRIALIFRKPVNSQFEITTDISKLKQIFTNLLDNSVKFTDTGEISFGYKSHDKDLLTCFVSDTGVGITTKDKNELFDIFRQAHEKSKRNYGDTGLGLAICKGNAELLGGNIWVESEPGKGTTFYFTLKYTQTEATSQTVFKPGRKSLHWKTHEILLVEDDACTIQYLTKILQQAGLKLIVARSGRETESFFKKLSAIDLVLLDMSLPDINGLDLVKKIKSIRNDIPIIVQTALTVDDDGKQFLNAGCDGYITKPYKRDEILNAINSFITA